MWDVAGFGNKGKMQEGNLHFRRLYKESGRLDSNWSVHPNCNPMQGTLHTTECGVGLQLGINCGSYFGKMYPNLHTRL